MNRRSYGTSRYATGEDDLTAGPPLAWSNPQTMPGIVWCGGLGMTPTNVVTYNAEGGGWEIVPNALADQFPLIMPGMLVGSPPPAWGNDNAITRVGQAVSFLQGASSPCRAKTGKVFLAAASMGWTNMCGWAKANVASVAGLIGIVPAADLNGVYARFTGGISNGIDFAYGGTYDPVTMGPNRNPVQFASQLDFPIHIWAVDSGGGTDGTILLSEILAFSTAAPNCTVTVLSGAHSTPAWPATFTADLANFLTANAP